MYDGKSPALLLLFIHIAILFVILTCDSLLEFSPATHRTELREDVLYIFKLMYNEWSQINITLSTACKCVFVNVGHYLIITLLKEFRYAFQHINARDFITMQIPVSL